MGNNHEITNKQKIRFDLIYKRKNFILFVMLLNGDILYGCTPKKKITGRLNSQTFIICFLLIGEALRNLLQILVIYEKKIKKKNKLNFKQIICLCYKCCVNHNHNVSDISLSLSRIACLKTFTHNSMNL